MGVGSGVRLGLGLGLGLGVGGRMKVEKSFVKCLGNIGRCVIMCIDMTC